MADKPKRKLALRANIWTLRLARQWTRVALLIVGIYVSLPFVAPTLMKLGLEGPARVIYTIYSPFCHQFAFRSFFLYGEQPVYPRANTGMDVTPYEAYVSEIEDFEGIDLYGFDVPFMMASRGFVGNERMGYKVTLCERDISIYIAIFIATLLYNIPYVRKRVRPAPLWLYVILGLGPIGIDGFSQLLSYPPFELWPTRETLPIFRVLTGGIFGFMTAWLGLPYIELSMRDTRRQLEHKLRQAGILA